MYTMVKLNFFKKKIKVSKNFQKFVTVGGQFCYCYFKQMLSKIFQEFFLFQIIQLFPTCYVSFFYILMY